MGSRKARKDSNDYYLQFQDVKMRSRSSPPMDVDMSNMH